MNASNSGFVCELIHRIFYGHVYGFIKISKWLRLSIPTKDHKVFFQMSILFLKKSEVVLRKNCSSMLSASSARYPHYAPFLLSPMLALRNLSFCNLKKQNTAPCITNKKLQFFAMSLGRFSRINHGVGA